MLSVACRALTGPININHDYSDSMAERDSGFIQIYAENNQEAYDNYLQAHRIGEHPEVRLPVMICEDGFITSHALENIELESDEDVKAFVGEYHPENYLLKHENPLAVGPYGTSPYYMEARVAQAEAMKNAKRVILEVAADFEKTFGRKYGFFEEYRMEDAQIALVLMGSSAGTAKAAVDELREQGVKAGLIKIRVFRALPRPGTGPGTEGLSGCGGAGQERGLQRQRRSSLRRDRPPPVSTWPSGQNGGHRLRPGRSGFHRGPGQAGVCPAGKDCGHRRGGPHLLPHGPAGSERGGSVTWLTI